MASNSYLEILMPLSHIKRAAKTMSGVMDVNGDGVIDHRDAIAAAKITVAAATGVGITAIASATAGTAIVAAGASSLASTVTAVAGAAAGSFIGLTVGTSTSAALIVVHAGNALFIGSSVVSSVSTAVVTAAAALGATAGSFVGGTIAGLPIIQQIALTQAVTAGDVILIAGVPMGVTAAIAAGLIAIIIVGAYAYYLLTKDVVEGLEGIDSPALSPI
ncbi:MAG: hypothetical protein ACOH2H_09115 [Cypionkella sp.]